jgi:cell division protein FtsX
LVTDKLRRVDQVAYVRFASVYRQFKTLEELMDEARAVLDAKRFEDPTQGKLFVEPATPATNGENGTNGNTAHADEPRAGRKRRGKTASTPSEDA